MEIISGKFAIRYKPAPTTVHRYRPIWAAGVVGAAWWALLALGVGCSGPDSVNHAPDPLIRSEGRIVTLAQFERAFEAARIAYSDIRSVEPEVIEKARLRLLTQMVEELLAVCRAEELDIKLEDNELEAAIHAIKSDYPENEFERMLLESAIPFSLWKERLRARLLMEKVIEQDLVPAVTITVQDIEAYFQAHAADLAIEMGHPSDTHLKRRIVEQLRRRKVEASYPEWMDGLRNRFAVEIDWELWARSQQSKIVTESQVKEPSP